MPFIGMVAKWMKSKLVYSVPDGFRTLLFIGSPKANARYEQSE
ncbi:MAG: hypothetical protein AAB819_03480 [Patescibacteria group bacterium]